MKEKIIKYRIPHWDRENFRNELRKLSGLPEELKKKEQQIKDLLNDIMEKYILDPKLLELKKDIKNIRVVENDTVYIDPEFIGFRKDTMFYTKPDFNNDNTVTYTYTDSITRVKVKPYPCKKSISKYRYMDSDITEELKNKVPEEIIFSLKTLMFEYADILFDYNNFMYDSYIRNTWGYRVFLGNVNTLQQLYDFNKDYYNIYMDTVFPVHLKEINDKKIDKVLTKKELISQLRELLADDLE